MIHCCLPRDMNACTLTVYHTNNFPIKVKKIYIWPILYKYNESMKRVRMNRVKALGVLVEVLTC